MFEQITGNTLFVHVISLGSVQKFVTFSDVATWWTRAASGHFTFWLVFRWDFRWAQIRTDTNDQPKSRFPIGLSDSVRPNFELSDH